MEELYRRVSDRQTMSGVVQELRHSMQEVERLCDRVVVVAHGKTVAQGTVAELSQQAGTDDFEDAFVRLAFAGTERQP